MRKATKTPRAAARGGIPLAASAVLGLLLGAALLFWLRGDEPVARPAAEPVRPTAGVRAEAPPAAPAQSEPAAIPAGAQLGTAEDGLPRRVIGAPVYHPRPAEEWQGMLVDLSLQPGCDRADGCGLAMACLEGRCGPCRADGDCGAGEACVLDHCLPTGGVGCRSASECGGDELCVLSGYSPGPRGNAGLESYCQARSGGVDGETEPRLDPPSDARSAPRPVTADALRESLRSEEGAEASPGAEPSPE